MYNLTIDTYNLKQYLHLNRYILRLDYNIYYNVTYLNQFMICT